MHIPFATVWNLIDLGIENIFCVFVRVFYSIKWMTWFPEHNNMVVRFQLITYIYWSTQILISNEGVLEDHWSTIFSSPCPERPPALSDPLIQWSYYIAFIAVIFCFKTLLWSWSWKLWYLLAAIEKLTMFCTVLNSIAYYIMWILSSITCCNSSSVLGLIIQKSKSYFLTYIIDVSLNGIPCFMCYMIMEFSFVVGFAIYVLWQFIKMLNSSSLIFTLWCAKVFNSINWCSDM